MWNRHSGQNQAVSPRMELGNLPRLRSGPRQPLSLWAVSTPLGASSSHRLAVPLSVALMEAAAPWPWQLAPNCWLQRSGQLLKQSVTSPPFLRNTTTRSKWEKSTGSLTVTSNFLECEQPEYFSSDRLPDNSWPSLICLLPISFLLHSAFCPLVDPHIFFQIVWLWNLSLPLLMDLSKFYRRGKNKSREGRKGKHLDVVLGRYVISELGLLSKKAASASTALCLLRKLSKSIWGKL